jgi:hypothetical protein
MRNNFRVVERLALLAVICHPSALPAALLAHTRDVWRKGWQGLATAEDLARAVDVLEEHGWARRVTVKAPGRGRPSEILHIHPTLRDRL